MIDILFGFLIEQQLCTTFWGNFVEINFPIKWEWSDKLLWACLTSISSIFPTPKSIQALRIVGRSIWEVFGWKSEITIGVPLRILDAVRFVLRLTNDPFRWKAQPESLRKLNPFIEVVFIFTRNTNVFNILRLE